ncbi:MAG: DUF4956 domain-containing protein [Planctomycetes bacterium]|nr:DUF4956 domain-containing protein [Planctomycetota bacterium]
MSNWQDMLLHGDIGATAMTWETVVLVALLAFCVGHIIGWVYMWSHTGLSYSRMFVASLVVIPVIVALVMTLMSGNIIIAFGLLAVFAVVRFRNVLKDTRDTTFILWGIVMGLGIGTLRFSTTLVGCCVVAIIFLYLRLTAFGSRHRYDVVLSLHWTGAGRATDAVKKVLRRHSVRTSLASERSAPDAGMDLSYRLLLRDPHRSRELVEELETTEGVAYVSLSQREEDESEI